MSNIKSIGGTEMGAAWTTRYEIDWTEQSSYDFKTSGSATIGGWTGKWGPWSTLVQSG